MAYGSSDKKKIKTKRISASSIVNSKKTDRFVEHFAFVKSLKNEISQYVFEHKLSLISSTSKNTLISHAKQFNCPELYSWEVQKMYQQIIDFYSNWVDKLTDNQKFVLQKEYKVTRYKRKVTNSVGEVIAVKGDIKKTEVIHKTTALTNLSNWLIYVDSSMLDSVLNNCRPMNKISMAAIAKEALIKLGVNIILRTGACFLYKDFLKSPSSLASISVKRYKNILSSISMNSLEDACNFVFSNNANAAAYFGSVKTKASTAALSAAFNSLSI